MKRTAIGILAHVDSGKTTLSEALLYTSGQIRRLGRVDRRDSFLDTNEIERDRGITIFSKQAIIGLENMQITLLDTPGHVDFSSETERVLWAIDAAILVINGSEGVQSHTETLWRLLESKKIPTFVFINKMDMAQKEEKELLNELNKRLGGGFVRFDEDDSFFEEVALCSESLCNAYLEKGELNIEELSLSIAKREVFPCYFGSALKLVGVDKLLSDIEKYAPFYTESTEFGARVFKISEDERKNRLTHMKITGGVLAVRDKLAEDSEEKISEIRIYSGAKYKTVSEAHPGDVCAVCGLSASYGGMGAGFEDDSLPLTLEPVFSYSVELEKGVDPRVALAELKKLETEQTQLHARWNSSLGEIQIQLMGEVQLEVLKRILSERFNLNVSFKQGGVIYKETISAPVEGVGHYEPLRHYAEVHLLLEPLKRGSGLVFASDCSEDLLGRNWQRLILTHLNEKQHRGVLTGSAITDMKITLKSGKAHLKHTEGGDFRQATYRAIRHGLKCAESVLLEPYYDFKLELPSDSVGKVMTDLERMGAKIQAPEVEGEMSVIKGSAPVYAINGYHRTLTSYTHGRGRMSCTFNGYDDCKNPQEVTQKIGYLSDADVENTADSVFCEHGAGFVVPWNRVTEYMHLESIFSQKSEVEAPAAVKPKKSGSYDEAELIRIFEATYGKIQYKNNNAMKTPKHFDAPEKRRATPPKEGPGYLLVDGYNIIFASDELKKEAADSLEDARVQLIEKICSYKILNPYEIILVFDAYKVKGNSREIEKHGSISVVYTKEAETADAYIEKVTRELGKKHRVYVATSDGLEQMIILGNGAQRIPAASFIKALYEAEEKISEMVKLYNDSENFREKE